MLKLLKIGLHFKKRPTLVSMGMILHGPGLTPKVAYDFYSNYLYNRGVRALSSRKIAQNVEKEFKTEVKTKKWSVGCFKKEENR